MENKETKKRALYIIFTVGVPGLGKTFIISRFAKYLSELPNHAVRVCTSDEVRSKVLADYYADNKLDLASLSQSDIYKIEVDNVNNIRSSLFKKATAQLNELEQSNAELTFFFVDKNQSSSSLVNHIHEQAASIFEGSKIIKGIFTPDLFVESDPRTYYPFKYETLIVGLCRSLHRKEHLTMKHGSLHSLLSFINCLVNQIKDDFDAKFPPEDYRRLHILYYDQHDVDEKLTKSPLKEAAVKLKEALDEVIGEKKTIEEVADTILQNVEILLPVNVFSPFDKEKIEALYKRLIE